MSPSNPIYKLFGRSPFRPLQEHMNIVCQCVNELVNFMEKIHAGDLAGTKQSQKEIARLEKEADRVKHDIRVHLPSGFFLPVPRIDLLQMLTMQDKIANKAKDIAGLMYGRNMTFPEIVRESYLQFLKSCIAAAEQAHKAINELDSLLETGFRGQEVTFVEALIEKLDAMEHETDEIQVEIRQQLFSVEKDYHAIDMLFLYKIIDWTGDLADRAQRVGGQLQVILAR